MDEIKNDARFAHIRKDMRFRKMKKSERKVKIDSRFKGMFQDEGFKMKYTVDKRGRPMHSTTGENLKKFYDVSESETSENEDDVQMKKVKQDKGKKDRKKKKAEAETSPEESEQSAEESSAASESDEEPDDDTPDQGEDVVSTDDDPDYARGGGDVVSTDDDESPDYARGGGDVVSTDDEDISGDEDSSEDHHWNEVDYNAPTAEEMTHRLAVCNMDWDRIKALDIMMLLNSFKPDGGVVKSVKIYPSDYGLQRMKEEEERGPTELVQRSQKNIMKENDEEYNQKSVRKYQMNRLKYYYAVVECDSKKTAGHIYEGCDGSEYEGSSNMLDLRYIPNDMSFDQVPKSQISEVPTATTYKPTLFKSSALQQTKVDLTWDETDYSRKAITMKRKFTKEDLEELDVQDYLASDSDSAGDAYGGLEAPLCGAISDDDEETQIRKYKALIQGIESKDVGKEKEKQDMEMEISWEPGLAETKSTQESLTPWEKYLDNKKTKRKAKRENWKQKRELEKEEGTTDSENQMSDDDLPEGIDLNDPYFKDELDKIKGERPSKTKDKKKKKKKKLTPEELEKQERKQAELSLLMLDEDDNKRHFSLKKIMEEENDGKKKKRRKRKHKQEIAEEKARKQEQDDFKIDIDDSRFHDLYQNPVYNIDPTAPEFKRTKAMEAFVDEKINRRMKQHEMSETVLTPSADKDKLKKNLKQDADPLGSNLQAKMRDPSLASMVKSLKSVTKSAQAKHKRKSKMKPL